MVLLIANHHKNGLYQLQWLKCLYSINIRELSTWLLVHRRSVKQCAQCCKKSYHQLPS